MGMPQQTSTPPPASTTFTLLPQTLQTYNCPTAIAILVLLVGFLLLTLGAKTPESQGWMLDLEAVLVMGRQGRKLLSVPVKIDDSVALPTDEVGMRPGLAVIARHFVQGINLDHHAFLAQNLQGFIHGVEGNGRELLAHLLIKIFCSGMVSAVLQALHHCQTLGGHRNTLVTQLLDEIFHNPLKPDYQIIIVTDRVKGKNAVVNSREVFSEKGKAFRWQE
jgi:hypothetical protein